MQIIRFLFTKMWNMKWLTLSSLLGLVIAVSLTTSIPMYTNGALKNLIYKELEDNTGGLPPGALTIRYQTIANKHPEFEKVQDVQRYITEEIPNDAQFPVEQYVSSLNLKIQSVRPVDGSKADPSKRRQLGITSFTSIEDQVNIIDGKLFSDKSTNGVIEAIVPKESIYIHSYPIGTVFNYPVQGGKGPRNIKVKVVGVFEPKDPNSDYWFMGLDSFKNLLIINDSIMMKDLLEKGTPLNSAVWYYAFDLRDIKSTQMRTAKRWLGNLDVQLNKLLPNTKTEITFYELLEKFDKQNTQLSILLFTLAAPILVLVFYFIAMNAQQSLERQRSDISVLRSRGGSPLQVFWLYLMEGLLLGVVSLIIGPMLGLLMAKSLGSSKGFLYFVNRKAVGIGISFDVWMYAFLAVFLAILASVIPALRHARKSIVNQKQEMARATKSPWWQKLFLDVILFGLAAYGWYLFQQRKITLDSTGLSSDQLQVEPLLFFVPSIFLFACGLLFIRIFPWVLRLVHIVTKRFRSVPVYLTMTQLSRSAKQYHAVMLLLSLTLGLGVYSASSARTIDLNSTDRALYQYGTDVVMQAQWATQVDTEALQEQKNNNGGNQPGTGGSGNQGNQGGSSGGGQGNSGGGSDYKDIPIRYVEPPFETFRNLKGVEGVARVYRTKASISVGSKGLGQGDLMAIDNVDFAKVANFKRDLYPKSIHPYKYLSLLGENEAAMIASDKFLKKYDIKPGTVITMVIKQKPVEFIVYAGVQYWPTLYPDEAPFFIVNLDYLKDNIPQEPYDVWMKVAPDGKVQDMVQTLADKNIYLVSIDDYRSEMIRQAKHPSRGGVFGILSLGFLISIFISLLGYILFWFFSLSQRTVQFGILRASGLSRAELTIMLLLEQILTAGTSIVVGILCGQIASRIFIPFMQTSGSAKTQVPPFQVIFNSADLKNLLIVVGFMMLIGIILLFIRIRALRVHQAVKLGEER